LEGDLSATLQSYPGSSAYDRLHVGSEGKVAPGTREIQQQIMALSGRDLQLWSITLLVVLVLSAGFAAVLAPNLVWKPALAHVEVRYLPQLFFGLISLVILFNVYIIGQKRELHATRKALVQELIFNERLEGLSLIDPLTQLFNRRALDQMLSKEVVRANRLGSSLTILMIDLDDFKSINTRFGHQVGDTFLGEAAQLLRTTFRGSDMVFRYGGDEFLVVMPETTEEQAENALRRLSNELELGGQAAIRTLAELGSRVACEWVKHHGNSPDCEPEDVSEETQDGSSFLNVELGKRS
jgi:diguanylate cyclase (GGDEF)-like protein